MKVRGDEIGYCSITGFKAEARFQRVCAVCGGSGFFQSHHVVTKQVLRDRYGIFGTLAYNTMNSLRVCEKCHGRHHSRFKKIKTTDLKSDNIQYAFFVMGSYAAQWLRRYYDDRGRDPRISELESTLV